MGEAVLVSFLSLSVSLFLPACVPRKLFPKSKLPWVPFLFVLVAHLPSLELFSCSCVTFTLFYGFESLGFLLL